MGYAGVLLSIFEMTVQYRVATGAGKAGKAGKWAFFEKTGWKGWKNIYFFQCGLEKLEKYHLFVKI